MRYSRVILDHVKNPRHAGELMDANATARVRSKTDGDLLQIQLRIEDEIIQDARFKVFGCGAAIAAGSMLTEWVIGKKLTELQSITNEQLSKWLGGLPPEKIHCSILAEQAIQAALKDYEKTQNPKSEIRKN